MPGKIALLGLAGACLAALVGCKSETFKLAEDEERIVLPPYIVGTIAEFATLAGGGNLPVRGYGVMVGLGKAGSAEVPPHLKEYLTQYLLKKNLGSWMAGTENVTPSRFLADMDTAVVQVDGEIPPGAPLGDRFEIEVAALPQTQTSSLEGGILMPLEMYLAIGESTMVDTKSKVWALASGPVFVNPFLDSGKAEDVARFRAGRVIGGGMVNRSRPIVLQLRNPDYARADLMQRRINERFPNLKPVAVAQDAGTIAINIPEDWRKEYKHFLQLIRHLPVRAGKGALDLHVRDIVAAMEQPAARYEELALVLEAVGRQAIPVIQPLYASRNPGAAYYAARAGLRLGDALATPVVIRFATSANSPLQIEAVQELGRHPNVNQAAPVLNQLLDDENELVRVAACDSLLRRGDSSRISRSNIAGQFLLDVVRSDRKYAIFASQSEQPRLILFGKDMSVARDVFFVGPEDLVTINAHKGADKLTIYRKIPRTGRMSEPFQIDFLVRTLVQTMGSLPELDDQGRPKGLSLTYSQIIRVLSDLCKRGDIRAKFVLQPREGMERIYRDTVTRGRPDMPGS